jgi:hypothetical protein
MSRNVGIAGIAVCRGEWVARLFHVPPHGKPALLLADELG